MLSKARKEEDSDSGGGEGSPTEEHKGKKKAAFDVEGAPLHYVREVENTTSGMSVGRCITIAFENRLRTFGGKIHRTRMLHLM